MTLDEIFEKYQDDQKIYRLSDKFMSPKSIEYAKQLKAWGNEKSRKLGYWIPDFMIEGAEATDWCLYNANDE